METTTDLANSIGLGTRQDAAFKGMPLTNFANKEYQINANNAKLEAERKRKEAELEKQLMSKINVTGKFDKIAAPQIQKAYANMVMNKGYSNPEALYQFNIQKQNHEIASADRAKQSEFIRKNPLLISPEVEDALINYNPQKLEELSKDPRNNLVKDEFLPDTYTLTAEGRIPRVDNISMVAKKFVPTDEAALDKAQSKPIRTVGDKIIYGTPVKDAVLTQSAVEFLDNPVHAKNWLAVHQDEIGKEVSKGVPLQQALINSFKDKNRFIETDTYTPSKNGGGADYFREGNTLTTGKTDKWTYTYDPSNGVVKINTGAVGGVPKQNLTYKGLASDGVHYKTDADGKPKGSVNKSVQIVDIKPLKNGEWYFSGKNEDGNDVKGITSKQSLESYMAKFPANDIIKQFYSKPSGDSKEATKTVQAISKLDKALAAFEKQVGRKPTATELDKIKQKYK